jgi:PKD repeat protein
MGRRLATLGALALVAAGTAASVGPVRAASTHIVQDTFQRANQSGWGTASDGMTWTSGSGLSVSSDEGLITNLGSSSDFQILGTATTADGNGLVRFAATQSSLAGMILRHQPNGNMDLVRYNGSGQFQFLVDSGGSWNMVSSTGYSITSGTFYWLRSELQGSSVSFKVWPDGSTEPSAWTWSGTSTTITAAGTMGLYGYAKSGSEVEFDSFSVAPLGTVTGPTAALTLSPSSTPVGGTVTASASGSSAGTYPISSYTFTFGDGTTIGPQAAVTATHVYTIGGVFTVTVTVTDSAGDSSQATASETVGQPVAALIVSPPSGNSPLAVTADGAGSSDASGVAITAYTFNFGDGTTIGPQASPTAGHTYTTAGGYTVTLTVTDATGATSNATAPVTVSGKNGPTAALTLNPPSTPVGSTVTASASGSSAGTYPISTYAFNFGDGTTIGPQASSTATHAYSTGGVFPVTVTVTDSAGDISQATASETVGQPVAALTVSPSSGNPPLAVTANGSTSSDASGVPITAYTFNFGDGTTIGPQASPTAGHTYTTAGGYTVTLTVTDATGATSTTTAPVSVGAPYIVQDTFQRPNQSGWGTASDGMPWSSGSSLSISSDEGLISSSAASSFETLGSATTADGNALVRFLVRSTSTDTAGIILRHQSNGNMDLARYDGNGHLQFLVMSGGSWTVVSQSSFSPSAGTFYWLRAEVQGSSVYLKVWAAGSTEPPSWTWSGSSSTITSAGKMGLYGYAASGAPVELDSFAVATVSAAPPNSTVTGRVTASNGGFDIAGVTVSTIPASTTATTGSSGTYSLPVASGPYTVVFTASAVGYNDNDVAGVTAPAGGSVTANQTLVAIPAEDGMDTFTQPNQTGGWSPSTDGQLWTSDIASPPNGVAINGAGVTGNQAWVDTSGSTLQDFDTWMGYPYANQQVTADVDISTVVHDTTYQHGPRLLARVQGGSSSWNAIVMTIDPPDGSNPMGCTAGDLSLWVTIPSSWTELAMVCQTITPGTTYHAMLDVIGDLVEGEVWTGSSAPGWQISATQSKLLGAGEAGTRTTGSYVDWANFQEVPITQISGQVTSAATGVPIPGASVTLSNGLTTTTDSNGDYSLSGPPASLAGGTSYTVTATASGYSTGSNPVTPVWGGTSTVSFSLT